MKIGVKIDHTVDETEVLVTAREEGEAVDALCEYIRGFDQKHLETLTGYKADTAKIINVTDIFRIYTGNQKVYIQTRQGEYTVRHRLYELEGALDKKRFLRISNSEIVNIGKIQDIDLGLTGRICIRFADGSQTYVSRRYIPKIKSSLGI